MAKADRLRKIRNIGIVAHIDAGKTTLTERLLFYSGRIHRIGDIDDGTTQMDWMPEERARGITITAAVTTLSWRGHEVHLIDTPGHVDFTVEVERSLRVLDGAVVVFSAVDGVEPQSETVWHQAEHYRVPRLAFINKMDRVGSDFAGALDQMRKKLGARPVPLQLPWGAEDHFQGCIDLVKMRAITFNPEDRGLTIVPHEIPAELKEAAAEARHVLVEAAADGSDRVMELYLGGQEVPEADLVTGLRAMTLSGKINPVLCGTALRDKGGPPVLDAVVDLLPSPLDLPPAKGTDPRSGQPLERPPDPAAPFSALVFKVQLLEGRRHAFARIYSGRVVPSDEVLVARTGTTERVARLFKLHADSRERVDEALAGDIVAMVGLKTAVTGDTVCTPKAPITFEGMQFARPVMSLAIEPKSSADLEKLQEAVRKISDEDPTLTCKEDPDTGQTVLSGMGELHLEVAVNHLKRDLNVAVNVGKPQVVYRETISRPAEAEEEFARAIQERTLRAKARVAVEPRPRGQGTEVRLEVAPPPPPAQPHKPEILLAAKSALTDALTSGPILGYPMEDITVRVTAISADDTEGVTGAVAAAAGGAFRKAVEAASPQLLVPQMAMEIIVPEEFLGEVIGDLTGRSGEVLNVQRRPPVAVVDARAPLTKLFGYSTRVRSLSQGRGTFTMKFDRFDSAGAEKPY
jgi:elongation factor G